MISLEMQEPIRALHQAFARRFGEHAADAKLETALLLRVLAQSKPYGRVLELGTGMGFATSYLASGLSGGATLLSIEAVPELAQIARKVMKGVPRVEILCQDAAAFLIEDTGSYDLLFADAEPGKFTHLDAALKRVAPGGLYVADDMTPLAEWTREHHAQIDAFRAALEARADFAVTELATGTGLLIAARVG